MVVLACLATVCVAAAQEPSPHYWHQGIMPPGAIGSLQLQRGGPLPGFFQPVEIKAPPGALVSLAVAGQFDRPQPAPFRVGMLIGQVYRIRVTNIRLNEGLEVFPTIEIVDRTYAPAGQQSRFAIPIELAQADLQLALDGKFVTRVIYLEDPDRALPVRSDLQAQEWFEAAPGQDPLAVADALGRPVAILRMGARLPDQGPDAAFFYGCPPFAFYGAAAAAPGPNRPASAPAQPGPARPAPAPPAVEESQP